MSSIRADQVGGRIVDNTEEVPGTRAPLVLNMDTFGQVTNAVATVRASEPAEVRVLAEFFDRVA